MQFCNNIAQAHRYCRYKLYVSLAPAGTTRLYMWTPAGASIVHIPLQNFCAHGVQWDSAGSAFALSDKEAFCCAYLAAPESVF